MNLNRNIKDTIKVSSILTTKLICQKSLCGHGHRTIYECHECNNSTHDTQNTKILYPKSFQNLSRCVKRHDHRDKSSKVKIYSILSYTTIISSCHFIFALCIIILHRVTNLRSATHIEVAILIDTNG